MDDALVERFMADGFVALRGAVPADTAAQCAELLWRETGCAPDDPGTWTRPVHWVGGMAQPPFAAAVNAPVLHEAFDALVGRGRWVPRDSLGSFPLRFPHPEEPDDAGWHIEGSFLPPGASRYRANVKTSGRALLMLFLFSEVHEEDAPTRVRVGSHLDIPPVLAPSGDAGVSVLKAHREIEEASRERPVVYATGAPGDVFLCHPFLVHAAQPHHGSRPRFMAQPPLHPAVPCELDRADGDYSPVERAIRRGLGSGG
ncbi:phytanoyl-CoA dioxygenase family protein [Streptomyces sp. NPDC050560]|uniref:phytanoyl-CoA dioxygenase family protein n=1 Tax=Streptomyces sp. NPDC050560 TaxID=3365630 RepID=UPI003792CAD9